ncbi:hypothetical protein PTRG_10027 [Pyrenophora tritici-repentis Pt-1C-BFP]|uniref:Uncharacterized protein n=1 Tax=Pyrenophora tritici-repentis (strain Pt-1C-BFP) TaxID=426418 RepID=B2WJ68_PYRTR|nr:uncharacterized protein PTRG_10027 [Pyrenophora tritici-repentis Pt-1C-BFP]EDU43078.1 hypothetical protein PTRG_10027 [Pyrenophora tritici-repentis Pt-1C-BFP]
MGRYGSVCDRAQRHRIVLVARLLVCSSWNNKTYFAPAALGQVLISYHSTLLLELVAEPVWVYNSWKWPHVAPGSGVGSCSMVDRVFELPPTLDLCDRIWTSDDRGCMDRYTVLVCINCGRVTALYVGHKGVLGVYNEEHELRLQDGKTIQRGRRKSFATDLACVMKGPAPGGWKVEDPEDSPRPTAMLALRLCKRTGWLMQRSLAGDGCKLDLGRMHGNRRNYLGPAIAPGLSGRMDWDEKYGRGPDD